MQLVFDIGGTHMRLAAVAGNDLVADPIIIVTPKNYSAAIAEFSRLANTLLDGNQATACGGGVPGPLDHEHTMLVSAPNLPDWANKPLQSDLQELLHCPVKLENDTAIGALGEAHRGAGQNAAIVAYLAVGTGVGGCRIVNGAIDESSQGFEPGAQLIAQSGRTAVSLEDLVSGTAINKHYSLVPHTPLTEQQQDEVCWNLAVGVHNLIMLWSPDIIVLGGGVINHDVLELDRVNTYVATLMDKFPRIPPVVASKLSERAGLYGALSLL